MNAPAAELFKRGNELLNRSKYSEAIECFKKVIEYGDNEFLSGSYVNIAKCLNERSLETKEDSSNQIEEYLQMALKIKPTNQAAFANYFWYHLFNKRFTEAIEYFMLIEVKAIFDQGIILLEKIHEYKNEREADAFYNLYKKNLKYSRILVNVAMWHLNNGTSHKAYLYLKESHQRVGNDINILSGLSLTCLVLNNPIEAEEYCILGINALEAMKNKENKVQNSIEGFYSNLALAYLNQHKYSEAVELLSLKVIRYPNNTDFHNLAFAQYMLGRFDEAYINCEKALFIAEDETSYFLMGECQYAKKEYERAILWYKKALAFINDKQTSYNVEDETMNIISTLLDSKKTLKKIYLNLINALLESNEYLSAAAFQEIALTKFPYDHDIKRLSNVIRMLDIKNLEIETVNERVNLIIRELSEQREKLEERSEKVREWALELIKLQDRCIKDDILVIQTEDDWRVIENQMVSIADAMKSSSPSDAIYQKIDAKMKNDFYGLNEKSLNFLITAEYLYQIHSNTSNIDFAPIMIEFCKVVENELSVKMKQKKMIEKKKNFTLGQLLFELERHRISSFTEFVPILKTILLYRNGSAHTGSTNVEKTGMVRNLLFEEGWLNYLIQQK
ncbi:hypothetical protein PVOR_01610 [Paenibacillus vortex V453]|uniref:TPR repeat-containing protein n=1 Tax=Paenibacillus vortex V453 TaxID=715225 RepID=A0A2R9T2Q9_9BACL|nr:tetratricopeptide repeat protein [Paenibacillus vortex]EFU43867.1 hypothetical protein PVOR_01610 [Paenibacillus vortex V453]